MTVKIKYDQVFDSLVLLKNILDIYNSLYKLFNLRLEANEHSTAIVNIDYAQEQDFLKELLDSCGIEFETTPNSFYFSPLIKKTSLARLEEARDKYNKKAPEAAEEIVERQDSLNSQLRKQILIANIWVPMQGEGMWENFFPKNRQDAKDLLEAFRTLVTLGLLEPEDLTNHLNYKIEQVKESNGVHTLKDLPWADKNSIRILKQGIRQIAADLRQGESIG